MMDKYKDLLEILKKRFEDKMHRHEDVKWEDLEKILLKSKTYLETILKMEESGGEPDLVDLEVFDHPVYVDMAKESPTGRRNLAYDEEARTKRKKNAPESSVEAVAREIGIKLLDENQYFALQNLEALDEKSSSWIKAEESLRKVGGGIFGDRRFNRTFIYHNGPESYYSSRGFRGYLEIKDI